MLLDRHTITRSLNWGSKGWTYSPYYFRGVDDVFDLVYYTHFDNHVMDGGVICVLFIIFMLFNNINSYFAIRHV